MKVRICFVGVGLDGDELWEEDCVVGELLSSMEDLAAVFMPQNQVRKGQRKRSLKKNWKGLIYFKVNSLK